MSRSKSKSRRDNRSSYSKTPTPRTEYMRWKYRNNKDEKISVDESGMTQFDPLLK